MVIRADEPIRPPQPVRAADCLDWAGQLLGAAIQGLSTLNPDLIVGLEERHVSVLARGQDISGDICLRPHDTLSWTVADMVEVVKYVRRYVDRVKDTL